MQVQLLHRARSEDRRTGGAGKKEEQEERDEWDERSERDETTKGK